MNSSCFSSSPSAATSPSLHLAASPTCSSGPLEAATMTTKSTSSALIDEEDRLDETGIEGFEVDNGEKEDKHGGDEPKTNRKRKRKSFTAKTYVLWNPFRSYARTLRKARRYCDYRRQNVRGINILPSPPTHQPADKCVVVAMNTVLNARVRMALAKMVPKRVLTDELSLQYLLDKCWINLAAMLKFLKTKGTTLGGHYVERGPGLGRKLVKGHFCFTISKEKWFESPDFVRGIRRQLEEHGPMLILFDAKTDFDDTGKGTYRGKGESLEKDEGLHAAVLVGEAQLEWIYRNSWGPDWGYEGHGKIEKGVEFAVVAPMFNVETLKELPWKPA